MAKFRVETDDTTTITRQAWIEADTEAEAREKASGEDWRTWEVIDRQSNAAITFIEQTDN